MFQQLDIDYVVDKPHETLGDRRSKGDAAVVRMFGVTGDGHSVCARTCTDLSRTFIAPCENFSEADCDAFRRRLNEEVSASRKNVQGVCVISVSLDRKQSLMHYTHTHTADRLVAKVTMGLPNMVSAARGILEKGFKRSGRARRCVHDISHV